MCVGEAWAPVLPAGDMLPHAALCKIKGLCIVANNGDMDHCWITAALLVLVKTFDTDDSVGTLL